MAEKNGLANFRRSELQNSARHRNKFPTLFQVECHVRVVFSCTLPTNALVLGNSRNHLSFVSLRFATFRQR